jgi:hypothetical protein
MSSLVELASLPEEAHYDNMTTFEGMWILDQ